MSRHRIEPTPQAGSRDPLLVGSAVLTGAVGAITLIASQRYLGLDAFAPLAQLWTIWAVLAAGLTFSFQQWAAVHQVTRRDILPGGTAPRITLTLTATSIVLLLTTTLLREQLFHSSSWVWPVVAALLPAGTALNGIRRGELARLHRRRGLAAVIAGENLIRLAATVTLISAGAGPDWFALALLAGFLVVIGRPSHPAGREQPERGLATLGAAATAGFLAHAFMFGSPVLLAVAGGDAADVSALFLVLTGVRIPFVVLQAIVPQLAVGLAGAADQPAAVATTRRWIVSVATGGGLVAALVGHQLGDLVIGAVFGIRGEVDPVTYALLSAASVLAACALVATVVLVVERRPRRITVAWGLPAITAPVITLTGAVAETQVLALWLLCTQAVVTVVALGATGWRTAATT